MKHLFFLLILIASSLSAAGIKAPFGVPSAKVLPKGIRNLSYKGLFVSASDKFNDSGTGTVMADPFFKEVTFKTIIDGKENAKDQGAIVDLMNNLGKDENDSFGETTGDVSIKANAYIPVIAFGATKKLTIALAIPMLRYSVNVDTGMNQKDQQLIDDAVDQINRVGATSKAEELRRKLANPIVYKLEDYNYKPLENENSTTKLGDIKLVSKYNIHSTTKNMVTVESSLTLPTGKIADHDKVINVPSGDGQTDLQAGVNYDYIFDKHITLSSYASYTYQMKGSGTFRIPEKSDSKLSPDSDHVTFDLGDIAIIQVAPKLHINGINFAISYALQYKGRDKYSGTAYDQERYKWLGNETRQNMQTIQLTVGYDTLSLFKEKKFPVPLSVTLNHTTVTAGKNVVKDPLTSLDFSMFF